MKPKASTCPSQQILADYGLGRLNKAGTDTVHQHLETCVDCRRIVASLSNDSFVNRLRDAKPAASDRQGASVSIADPRTETPTEPARTPDRSRTRTSQSGSPESAKLEIPAELADHPDYEILNELGRGGMGTVYLARNRMMDRMEVLKVVSQSLLNNAGSLERFQQEIRAAARLQHPNIVAAYTVLRPGKLLVFAMEYVDGKDLLRVVKQRGPLPVVNAAFYAQQVALGLQHAHEKGMVHRDIKPNNLMLSIENKKHVVKILDFGLAKATMEKRDDGGLTKSGQMLGTPDYIAPEQSLDAQKADIRADIYSLGCTLYFLLAGRPPFQRNSLFETLTAHHHAEPAALNQVRADVPPELNLVVAKMMAKDPANRYQTPDEVAKALGPFFKAGGNSPTPAQAAQTAPALRIAQAIPEGVEATAPSMPETAPLQSPATPGGMRPTGRSRVAATSRLNAKRTKNAGGNWKKPPVKLIAVGAAAFFAALLGVIVIFRDHKGKEITRVEVPQAASAEVKLVEPAKDRTESGDGKTGKPVNSGAKGTLSKGGKPDRDLDQGAVPNNHSPAIADGTPLRPQGNAKGAENSGVANPVPGKSGKYEHLFIDTQAKILKAAQGGGFSEFEQFARDDINRYLEFVVHFHRGSGGYHPTLLGFAANQLNDSYKDKIFQLAQQHFYWIYLIEQKGWLDDFRPILRKCVAEKSNLSEYYAPFLAEMRRSEDVPLLLKATEEYPSMTEELCKYIPSISDVDLTPTVENAWELVCGGPRSEFEKSHLASFAISFGIPGALAHAVDLLEHPELHNDPVIPRTNAVAKIKIELKRRLDASGSVEDLIRWYHENERHLKFDKKQGKFVITGTPGADPIADDGRIYWGLPGGYYRREKSNEWVRVFNSSTSIQHFVETERTADYIELHGTIGGVETRYRLYADHLARSLGDDPTWKTFQKGKWDAQPSNAPSKTKPSQPEVAVSNAGPDKNTEGAASDSVAKPASKVPEKYANLFVDTQGKLMKASIGIGKSEFDEFAKEDINHFIDLVKQYHRGIGGSNTALLNLVTRNINESHKPKIFQLAQEQYVWIYVIQPMGWLDEFLPILRKGVAEKPGFATYWGPVLAEMQRPEDVPLLIKATEEYPTMTEELCKYIPSISDVDLTPTVENAWELACGGRRPEFEKSYLAPFAIRFGILGALAHAVDMIEHPERHKDPVIPMTNAVAKIKVELKARLDASGSVEDLIRWYHENERHLKFDKKQGKFVSTRTPAAEPKTPAAPK